MRAKNALTLAAILIGIALGYVPYQSISDLKSENTKQTQANQQLREQVARLQAKLNAPNAQSDFRGTLLNGCKEDECLVEMGDGYNSYLIGIGVFKGFYRSVQRSAWGETKNCDTLVLADGTEALLREYMNLIKQQNTVNSLDPQNRIQFNLNLSQVSPSERDKILNSKETTPIELIVLEPLPVGKDMPVCHSFVEILRVK